jgi:prolyl-tRNA synthetase
VPEKAAELCAQFEGCGHSRQAGRQRSIRRVEFNQWEMKGVPLRIEIGPKDIEKNQVVIVRRDDLEKRFIPMDGLASTVKGHA